VLNWASSQAYSNCLLVAVLRQLDVLPLLYVIYINPAADGLAYVQFPLRLACEKLLAALRSRVVSCFRLYISNFSRRDVPMRSGPWLAK